MKTEDGRKPFSPGPKMEENLMSFNDKEYQKSFDAGRKMFLNLLKEVEDSDPKLAKQYMVHGAFATACQAIHEFGDEEELVGLFDATLSDLAEGAGKPTGK